MTYREEQMNRLPLDAFPLEFWISWWTSSGWRACALQKSDQGYRAQEEGLEVELTLTGAGERVEYRLQFAASFPTRLRFRLRLSGQDDLYHVIPCNIYGDNNLSKAAPGYYPNLTTEYPEHAFSSSLWEFRADRASHPVSMLCCKQGCVGISIDPYSDCAAYEDGFIRNGVFAELDDAFGVSLGYGNAPFTFRCKEEYCPPTQHLCQGASASGSIFAFRGRGRQDAHRIIRAIYAHTREIPKFKRSLPEAAAALVDSLIHVNWSEEYGNFTERSCQLVGDRRLIPWRPLVEIGWTGGAMMAYPLLVAEHVLGMSWQEAGWSSDPRQMLADIVNGYNPESGLLNDVTGPWRYNPENHMIGGSEVAWIKDGHSDSGVYGWWSDYGVTGDAHCAYTNGSAVFYILKSLCFLKERLGEEHEEWVRIVLRVLDTMVDLQREDGNYGYTYSSTERKVLNWDGFVGCWFAAAMPYAYRFSGDRKYLDSAARAMEFYRGFVLDLNCWGAPMDTWKSVDQEGNLAFIRAARAMHEVTQEARYLEMMEEGAQYEYLWRYGFRARPEFKPLKGSGWNSCGGSVTSVSNVHIHPMGVYLAEDLEYLAQQTGDAYHRDRADDSIAWIMNCMELYPEVSGYGQYGVLTERFCPSDGLTIEKFPDGSPSSLWFSYNGWAGAVALEGVAERLLREQGCR